MRFHLPPLHSAFALLCCTHVLPLLAADEKPLTSTIKQVTVFLSGAQIERTAAVDLPKGTSHLVFKDLSEELDPATVQVSLSDAQKAGKGFSILSVKHRIDHGTVPTGSAEVVELEARAKGIQLETEDLQNAIGIWQNEEQRLLRNEGFDGGEQGLTAERIKAINDYFRERITAVRAGMVNAQRRINELNEELQRVRLQLDQVRGRKPKARSEVLVEVSTDKAVHCTFVLRYVVRSAGWSPHYDIRVNSVQEPLALTYKAEVFQSTGEDWNDVHLELASGDPKVSGVKPEMAVWRIAANVAPPGPANRPDATYNAAVREVRGVLRDGRTGEALPFASVYLTAADGNLLNGATTDADGYYAVAVPPNARKINFKYLGFQDQQQEISSATINASLDQNSAALAEVEVTRYKVPLIDKDAAGSTTVYRNQFKSSPSRQTTINYVDGVQVITGGVPSNYGDVTGGLVNLGPQVATRRSTTHFVFSIAVPYTIPSDGQGHNVVVQELEVPSIYRYYCTPRLDPNAYLFAKATGWDKLDLLPGPANLYFEGTFIGGSFLDTDQVYDTLDISLGRDRSVVVERKKQASLSQRTFTGSKRVDVVGWEVNVRNTKRTAVDLVITDQVPVSANSDVEVDITEHGSGVLDEVTGFITWRYHLAPNSTARHELNYTVKAPKHMNLILE